MREWTLLSWRIQMTDELVKFLLALVRLPVNLILGVLYWTLGGKDEPNH